MTRSFSVLVVASLVGLMLGAATEARAQRGRRTPRGPGSIIINSTVDGAEVLIDEESVGFTPLEDPLEVDPGAHTVRVRRAGYTEYDGVVSVTTGQRSTVEVDMIALGMVLTVRSTPDEARVFIDGTFRGTTPVELELNEGEHSLRVTSPRFHESVQQVTARAGQTDLISVELEAIPEEMLTARPIEWYEEPLTWILIGGGAIVVAAAIIAIAILTAQSSPINDFCGEGDELCDIVGRPTTWSF